MPPSGLRATDLSKNQPNEYNCTTSPALLSSTLVHFLRRIMSTFGDRLKALRENADLSQRELADRAGLTRDGVASLEQGRRGPTWDTVQALARALDVSCDVFRDDRPAPVIP